MISRLKIKENVRKMRSEGMTYSEIKNKLNISLPKSTISYWCQGVSIPPKYQERIKRISYKNLKKARILALALKKQKRQEYIDAVYKKVAWASERVEEVQVAKIVLSMLYLGEGTKQPNGVVVFGNSNPNVIKLFLKLLRSCYDINESKLRCTVQCRADSNVKELKSFWSQITNISFERFYKTQIDKRTIGKPTRKSNYKGVCRITYLSTSILQELFALSDIIIAVK